MKNTKKMQSFRLSRDKLQFLKETALKFECSQTELLEEAIDHYLKLLIKYAPH